MYIEVMERAACIYVCPGVKPDGFGWDIDMERAVRLPAYGDIPASSCNTADWKGREMNQNMSCSKVVLNIRPSILLY